MSDRRSAQCHWSFLYVNMCHIFNLKTAIQKYYSIDTDLSMNQKITAL